MTILVVDANIMASALMGTTLPLLAQQAERGVVLAAPNPQLAETRKVLHRRDLSQVEARMRALMDIVEPLDLILFGDMEEQARARLQPRGQVDWPVLAAAMALGAGIWSHDRDFFGVGVPVWSNDNIKYVEAVAG